METKNNPPVKEPTAEELLARLVRVKRKIPTRYMMVNGTGDPIGFYSDDVHGADTIPKDAIKISEAQYKQIHEGIAANPMKRHRFVGGVLVVHDPELTLEQKARVAAVNGLTVSLSGSITLAPMKFPTDVASQRRIGLVVTLIKSTENVAHGDATYPMKDSAGVWHKFNSIQYSVVAAAIANYCVALDLIAEGNPLGVTTLPDASVSFAV